MFEIEPMNCGRLVRYCVSTLCCLSLRYEKKHFSAGEIDKCLKRVNCVNQFGLWDSCRPEAQRLVSALASCLALTLVLPCCIQTHLSAY